MNAFRDGGVCRVVVEFGKGLVPSSCRPVGYLTRLAKKKSRNRVQGGPFAGMRYVDEAIGSCLVPKLIGFYEMELWPVVRQIIEARPDGVIDIGAAEGYYAVGLAWLLPHARVIAFEQSNRGRRALCEMAVLNDVEHRLDVRGRCEPSDLEDAVVSFRRPIIICDVEGYEAILLDPKLVPSLKNSDVLVELHDLAVPGIGDCLRRRFSGTHDFIELWPVPRDVSQFPWRTLISDVLPRRYISWIVSEWRQSSTSWLWLVSKVGERQ